jgi:hypothetical protein
MTTRKPAGSEKPGKTAPPAVDKSLAQKEAQEVIDSTFRIPTDDPPAEKPAPLAAGRSEPEELSQEEIDLMLSGTEASPQEGVDLSTLGEEDEPHLIIPPDDPSEGGSPAGDGPTVRVTNVIVQPGPTASAGPTAAAVPLKEKLSEANARIKALKKEVKEAGKGKQQATEEKQRATEEKQRAEEQMRQASAGNAAELERLRQVAAAAQRAEAEAQRKIEENTGKIEAAEKAAQAAEEAKEAAQAELEQALEAAEEEVEKSKQEVEAAKEEAKAARDELKAVQQKLSKLEGQHDDFVRKTAEGVENSEKSFQAVQERAEKAEKEIELTKQSLEAAKQEVERTKKALDDAKKEAEEAKKALKALQGQMARLEQTANDAMQAATEAKEEAQESKRALEAALRRSPLGLEGGEEEEDALEIVTPPASSAPVPVLTPVLAPVTPVPVLAPVTPTPATPVAAPAPVPVPAPTRSNGWMAALIAALLVFAVSILLAVIFGQKDRKKTEQPVADAPTMSKTSKPSVVEEVRGKEVSGSPDIRIRTGNAADIWTAGEVARRLAEVDGSVSVDVEQPRCKPASRSSRVSEENRAEAAALRADIQGIDDNIAFYAKDRDKCYEFRRRYSDFRQSVDSADSGIERDNKNIRDLQAERCRKMERLKEISP